MRYWLLKPGLAEHYGRGSSVMVARPTCLWGPPDKEVEYVYVRFERMGTGIFLACDDDDLSQVATELVPKAESRAAAPMPTDEEIAARRARIREQAAAVLQDYPTGKEDSNA